MARRRTAPLIITFVLSLAVVISLLVVWIIYAVRSASRIQELAQRVSVPGGLSVHWVVLGIGCALLCGLIVAISYQLAQSLATRRYSLQQDEFVSNVTHELKSPLTAIKLHAQTLEAADLDAEGRARSVDFILQQAERMGVLVDNVLENSRLAAGKRVAERHPIDLAHFFEGYFAGRSGKLTGRDVCLKTWIETSATVLATEEGLERVLDNLLDNAIRFSGAGGEVRCRITDRGERTQIEVEDDGLGIPKNELPKIFDRFYQVGREIEGRRKGSGLGLAIVSQLVRQEMNGTIRAFSAEGRPGTRFVIELPIDSRGPSPQTSGRTDGDRSPQDDEPHPSESFA